MFLLNACIENAKGLFHEIEGEFYPFGMVTDNSNLPLPYYLKIDDEYPNKTTLFNDLIFNLYQDISNNKYSEVSVCALASRHFEGHDDDLLDIKILTNNGLEKDYLIIIDTDYNNYSFEVIEIMDFKGSFSSIATQWRN